MFSTIFGGLKSIATIFDALKILAVVAVVGALLGGSYKLGRDSVQQEWDAEKSAQQKAVLETKVEQARETAEAVIKYVDRVRTGKVRGDTIIKEVPKYVTKEDDQRCVIGSGFVRLWNDANQLSGAAGEADEGATEPERDEAEGEPEPERGGEATRQRGEGRDPDPGAAPGAPGLDPQDAGG